MCVFMYVCMYEMVVCVSYHATMCKIYVMKMYEYVYAYFVYIHVFFEHTMHVYKHMYSRSQRRCHAL